MPKKKAKKNNLELAGIFVAVVLGLIFLSFVVKFIFIIKDSKFDGNHKFNVLFVGKNQKDLVSFTPQSRSISILKIENPNVELSKKLDVPIDGTIILKEDLNIKNLSTTLFKSEFPLGQRVDKLTPLDLLRLALFSRTVSSDAIYTRVFSESLSDAQINTILSLTFTDPAIYEENLSIEIVNATQVNGLGAKLALLVTNIGGNPILVSNSNNPEEKSKLVYYGKETYTVDRLSSYFNLVKEKTDKQGIADVIIIIGKDIGDKF